MKIVMKKLISISLTFLLTLLILNVSKVSLASDIPEVNVIIRGNLVTMEEKPIIKDNRIYVPIRHISEDLGFKVEWISTRQTAKLTNSEATILVSINTKEVLVNDEKVMLNEKTFAEKGRIFVPLRSVAELLSQRVDWDQKNKTVIVGDFASKEDMDGSLEEYFSYENEKYGFNLKISNYLQDKIVIEEENNIVSFYDKYNYENENIGNLFNIRKTDNLEILHVVPSHVLKYENEMYYIVNFASDVQYVVGDKTSTNSYMETLKLSKEFLLSFNLKSDL